MLPKDRLLIHKLKKRISFLIIVIFSLSYWIRVNYYDLETKYIEVEDLHRELLENQKEISQLQSKLDSFNKPSKVKKEIKRSKNIINTKKLEIKKDTITEQKTDTTKLIIELVDTSQIN
jgi:predicted RNase H-like nuclease (RuvC/YqgF family)